MCLPQAPGEGSSVGKMVPEGQKWLLTTLYTAPRLSLPPRKTNTYQSGFLSLISTPSKREKIAIQNSPGRSDFKSNFKA